MRALGRQQPLYSNTRARTLVENPKLELSLRLYRNPRGWGQGVSDKGFRRLVGDTNVKGYSDVWSCALDSVQGYLTYKKTSFLRTLPQAYIG